MPKAACESPCPPAASSAASAALLLPLHNALISRFFCIPLCPLPSLSLTPGCTATLRARTLPRDINTPVAHFFVIWIRLCPLFALANFCLHSFVLVGSFFHHPYSSCSPSAATPAKASIRTALVKPPSPRNGPPSASPPRGAMNRPKSELPRTCSPSGLPSGLPFPPKPRTLSPSPLSLSNPTSPTMSAIVTISVGPAQRLFAAHEDVLAHSPLLASLCHAQFFAASGSAKRVDLPDELPEVFSCLLEYMYKGDYFPRLEYDKRRRSYVLEDASSTEGGRARRRRHRGPRRERRACARAQGLGRLRKPSPPPSSLLLTRRPVLGPQVRPPGPPEARAPQAGPAERRQLRDHPRVGAPRVRAHAGHGRAPARALPRPHRPQPLDVQALRHDAGRDGARRAHVLRPLRRHGQPHRRAGRRGPHAVLDRDGIATPLVLAG